MKAIRRLLLGVGLLALLNIAPAQETTDSSQSDTASQVYLPVMNPNGPVPPLSWAFNGITVNNTPLVITSVSDLDTILEALQSEPPVPLASLPTNRLGQVPASGFWSLQNPYWPPLPCDGIGADVWPLGNGNFILDDKNVDYAALQAAADAEAAQTASATPMMRMSMMASMIAVVKQKCLSVLPMSRRFPPGLNLVWPSPMVTLLHGVMTLSENVTPLPD